MPYTPTDWKTGDVIYAEEMNNMESGIVKAGSVYTVGMSFVLPEEGSEPTITLQKTFGEIKSAIEYGSVVFIVTSLDPADPDTGVTFMIPDGIVINADGGGTVFVNNEGLIAITDNDYPSNASK